MQTRILQWWFLRKVCLFNCQKNPETLSTALASSSSTGVTVQTACVLVFVASSIEIAHSNKTELSFFRETNQDKDLQKKLFCNHKMDADDEKTLQIGDTEGTSSSNGGRMSITEEEANEASDGLETEDDDSNEDEDLSEDSNDEEGKLIFDMNRKFWWSLTVNSNFI